MTNLTDTQKTTMIAELKSLKAYSKSEVVAIYRRGNKVSDADDSKMGLICSIMRDRHGNRLCGEAFGWDV